MIFLTLLEGVHRFDITLRTLMPLMALVQGHDFPLIYIMVSSI